MANQTCLSTGFTHYRDIFYRIVREEIEISAEVLVYAKIGCGNVPYYHIIDEHLDIHTRLLRLRAHCLGVWRSNNPNAYTKEMFHTVAAAAYDETSMSIVQFRFRMETPIEAHDYIHYLFMETLYSPNTEDVMCMLFGDDVFKCPSADCVCNQV